MIIDGEVGRQLYSSISLIGELDKKKMLKKYCFSEFRYEWSFTEAQFDEFMKALGNRKVYWINVRVPTRRWQNQVNSLLSQMDKKYDNLTVIDWFNYSNAHDDWFYDDRVHQMWQVASNTHTLSRRKFYSSKKLPAQMKGAGSLL